jgi:heme O synthase-like polyprenyltransferase
VGSQAVNQPAYYARTGSTGRDLIALLHPPYTMWHLSYVAMGAAIAPRLDWIHLAGTVLAFLFGMGIGAHALDELHDRPLGTELSRRALLALAVGGISAAAALAVAGALVISPWVAVWGTAGVLLAIGYPLEVPKWLHTDLGFGLSWGGFPVLVGYWAQTQTLSVPAVILAAVATLLSMTQRFLSTPARFVRRRTDEAEASFDIGTHREHWSQGRLLDTWERPLKLLGAAMPLLAVALLALHL